MWPQPLVGWRTGGIVLDMAVVRSLTQATATTGARHPTEVDCTWQVVRSAESVLLQLSTYGSDQRMSQPKVSQTLQLDRAIALALAAEIHRLFSD